MHARTHARTQHANTHVRARSANTHKSRLAHIHTLTHAHLASGLGRFDVPALVDPGFDVPALADPGFDVPALAEPGPDSLLARSRFDEGDIRIGSASGS
jgi:hypothetical protein